ncbi:MAG: hypothetical protein HY920_04090 [Elusimicrobia bacterium]|nr:hypothetical protein [Elusimicrobiota bacterium]
MLNRKKAVLFAGLFALIVMLAIPLILAAILSTISLGIVFKKAGQRWWYGLIPIYNIYVCFKIAGKPKWFKNLVITIIAYNLICLLISFLIPAGPIQSFINSAIQVAINAIVLITLLLVDIYLARKFGKSGAFGVGLYFLPFIFMAILAFGKSQYLGNQSPQAPQPPQPNVIS